MKNFSLLVAGVALLGCSHDAVAPDRAGAVTVKFLAFGDAGSGSPEQIAVGRAMADVCAARHCDFALELGDNFYDQGVASADDPQFDSAFETPYAPLDHLRVPIYAVLGNHDNTSRVIADGDRNTFPGDGGDNSRGAYQVEYGRRTDRRSQMWRMPARYYRFVAPAPAFGDPPFAEFFALDSSPLAPYRDDPDQAHWNAEAYATAQEDWLAGAMKESRARWKIALAHHPYISNGAHGNAGRYDDARKARDRSRDSRFAPGQLWKKLLDDTVCAHGADLYLSGHDHDLEWLRPLASCGKTEFILSGAGEGGAKRRGFGQADRNPVRWQRDQAGGFFWIELAADRMTVAAFTVAANGNLARDAREEPVPEFQKTVERSVESRPQPAGPARAQDVQAKSEP